MQQLLEYVNWCQVAFPKQPTCLLPSVSTAVTTSARYDPTSSHFARARSLPISNRNESFLILRQHTRCAEDDMRFHKPCKLYSSRINLISMVVTLAQNFITAFSFLIEYTISQIHVNVTCFIKNSGCSIITSQTPLLNNFTFHSTTIITPDANDRDLRYPSACKSTPRHGKFPDPFPSLTCLVKASKSGPNSGNSGGRCRTTDAAWMRMEAVNPQIVYFVPSGAS